MALSCGIVGLPNAGKSTLFNALLAKRVALVADYPFTTIEPNTGVVKVLDKNLLKLGEVFKGAQVVPSSIKFIDIAGLVKGAHKGEGLGNEFLSHIQQVDLILHLVGGFNADEASAMDGVEIINLELVLKDQQVVNSLLSDKNLESEKRSVLERVKVVLEKGGFILDLGFDKEEKELMGEFNLLTNKLMFYVLNLKEGDLKSAEEKVEGFREKIGADNVQFTPDTFLEVVRTFFPEAVDHEEKTKILEM